MIILIHQPGKVGDIINCLPIAAWYADHGHTIYWLCPEKYHSMFDYVDYVTPVAKRVRCDRYIDLSFGLVQNTSLHNRWLRERILGKSFVTLKYELAGVPITELRKLRYNRKTERENKLFKRVIPNAVYYPYVLTHKSSDYGSAIKVVLTEDVPFEIKFSPISDFTIFDWREVIEQAASIHCIDSSLCNFVDCIPTDAKLFYYITDRVPVKGDRTILTKNWNYVG